MIAAFSTVVELVIILYMCCAYVIFALCIILPYPLSRKDRDEITLIQETENAS